MRTLGRGTSPSQSGDLQSKLFNFTKSLPPEFSIARADTSTCATYRNSSGALVTAAANTARIDYDQSGKPLGLLIEGSRQNKLALYNASPTATTGLSVASGMATLSVVSDTTALTAAGLHLIGNGNVIRINNIGLATQATIAFATTFGTTNAHSLSLYARIATAHNPTLTRSGTSPQSLALPQSNAYADYKLENVTGHATTDKMQILVPAGCDMYVILYQMEEGVFCSSKIITAGAAATRQADRVRALNLNTATWWNNAQGYITARYRPYMVGDSTSDQYIAYASDGTTANSIGMRIAKSTDRDIILNFRNASTGTFPASTDILHIAKSVHATGMAWKSDKMVAQNGGVAKSGVPAVSMPVGLTELAVGARNGANELIWGWIERLEVGLSYKEQGILGTHINQPNDILVMGAGQSLMSGNFSSQEISTPGGRNKFTEIISTLKPDVACAFTDGSTGSSAASKTSDASNYWFDVASNARGPALNTFYADVRDSGISPNVIIWAQGEADSTYIDVTTSRALYKQALYAIFNDMRATLGNPKIMIQRLGRRGAGSYSNTANAGMQQVREVQQEIAAENPGWCSLGADIYDQDLYDNLHMKDAGYITVAERNARILLGGSKGPQMISAVRSGTTVTVTIAHDGGTDFTPASAISGFTFRAGSSEISISSAFRTNATTVTLTLASTPAATPEILYCGYDGMPSITIADVLKDNASPSMPLRTGKVVL